jgi:type VI secretion system protein ImpA
MPIPLDSLLAPISPDKPCGDDVSYDPAFQELETLILGKPETQFSAAEPPDWVKIRKATTELLARSKHLRILMMLTASNLRLEGLAGFRDGLTAVSGMLDAFWETLYPRLDPDDNNDPTERLNIISSLAAPVAQGGDTLKFLEGVRSAPLSSSAQMGRFNIEDITRSQSGVEGATPTAAQIEASFRDTPPDQLEKTSAVVNDVLAIIKALKSKIGDLVGEHRVPDFDPLVRSFRDMQKALAPYLASGAPDAAGGDASAALEALAAGPAAAAPAARGGLSGGIDSREEVLRALDMVCAYYTRREPSSPVPLLLERAKRLVHLDFMAIIGDLSPEALEKVQLIAGIRP